MQGFIQLSYQCFRELHLNSRLNINFDKVSGALNVGQPGQGHMFEECVKDNYYARTITATEKCTSILDSK